MAPIVVLGLFVFVFVCVVVGTMHYRIQPIKQAVAAHLSGRDSLSSRQFAESFFSVDQQPIAMFVIETFRESLIFDTSRMRPDDRLFADLRVGQIDGLEPNEIDFAIKERFGCSMVPTFVGKDPSVRELIDFISKSA